MPKFKYNGDHKEMISYGYDFSGDEVVDVPESDTMVVGKLTNNSHFDLIDSDIDDLDDSEIEKILGDDESVVHEKWGIFKKKKDGSPYSNPDKVFSNEMERYEVKNFIKENYDNPDNYVIKEKIV